MNFIMNIYRIPIFLVYLAITSVLILGFAVLLGQVLAKPIERLVKILKLPLDNPGFILMFAIFLGITAMNVMAYKTLVNKYNDGDVKEIFISEKSGQQYLTVLFERRDTGKAMTYYNFKIKTFDLLGSECLGQVTLSKSSLDSNYRIYGPAGTFAWGFGPKKVGVQAIDLTKPAIIADEKEIIKRNPQLGSIIKISHGSYTFNPINQTLHVRGSRGELLYLASDLKAYPLAAIPKSAMNLRASQKSQMWLRWQKDAARGSSGRVVHLSSTEISPQKAVLLAPKVIKEWDKNARVADKVWVEHYATLEKNSDHLISYIAADGRELSKTNLTKEFNSKKLYPIATATFRNKILVFVSDHKYKLTALQMDKNTGKLVGRIDYF